MKIINHTKFKLFCDEHQICLPEKEVGVGRYPSFEKESLRTINIHFLQDDVPDYLYELLRIILRSEDAWILASKFRYISIPIALGELADNDAILFEKSEQNDICEYLSKTIKNIECVSDDIFLLSKSGDIIIRYDHHVISEGLSIDLNNVNITSILLKNLNDFGAELELYYLHS